MSAPPSILQIKPWSSLQLSWHHMFSSEFLKKDLAAAFLVTAATLPLALSISLIVGISPAVAILSSAAAGLLCALFSGAPLSISGPATAMALISSSIVDDYGFTGLAVAATAAGGIQLAAGTFGLGNVARNVPTPVVAGFTTSIGILLFLSQLPLVFGLPPADSHHFIDVILHFNEMAHHIESASLITSVVAFALVLGLPLLSTRLPAMLVSLAVSSSIPFLLNWKITTLGEQFQKHMHADKVPSIDDSGAFIAFIGVVLSLALFSSAKSLVGTAALPSNTVANRFNPNQELFAQGLGNIATALLGGSAVSTSLAASSINVQAGAQTRRASVMQALLLLACIAITPFADRLPAAAIAGMTLALALRLINLRVAKTIAHTSNSDRFLYLSTVLLIVLFDFSLGLLLSVIVALVAMAWRTSQMSIVSNASDAGNPARVTLTGKLTFLSSKSIRDLQRDISEVDAKNGIILELDGITEIDQAGSEMLAGVLDACLQNNIPLVWRGASEALSLALKSSDAAKYNKRIAEIEARTEADVSRLLPHANTSARDRLLVGIGRFQRGLQDRYSSMLATLAHSQEPHTLFITCCDSRIDPTLITSTDPGELFVVRNVGALVPAFGPEGSFAEGAGVEYAVGVLGVRDIVVCGHSNCGAMKTLKAGKVPAGLPSVERWLKNASSILEHIPADITPDELARRKAVRQLDNLQTYPVVQEKLKEGKLRLHAWFYDVGTGGVLEWNSKNHTFEPVGDQSAQAIAQAVLDMPTPSNRDHKALSPA